MKESDVEGIVLKSFKYRNSSLIGEVYTADYGLRTFILKGLTSKKNRGKGILFRPPNIINFTAYFRENREINLMTEIESAYLYQFSHRNVKKAGVALFYVEVFRNMIYDGDIHPELYTFMKDYLIQLDRDLFRGWKILTFLTELSQLIGIGLPLPTVPTRYFDLLHAEFTDSLPGHSYCLNEVDTALIRNYLMSKQGEKTFSGSDRKKLFRIYISYLRLQLDNFKELKSPEIIKEVLFKPL